MLDPSLTCSTPEQGMYLLPMENSNVYKQLVKTVDYAEANQMKINYKKTKVIVFNPWSSIVFMPEICLDNNELEVVEEIRLLGIILRADMKWIANTENMVVKANKRLWILRRLKFLGAQQMDLVDIYSKQIRSVLELAVPAWHGGLTLAEQIDIERVQKCAAHIILGSDYETYKQAVKTLGLDTLQSRRDKLCLKFGKKAEKHPKFSKWFRPTPFSHRTRQEKSKYCSVFAKHSRFKKSPLSFITSRLNEFYTRK